MKCKECGGKMRIYETWEEDNHVLRGRECRKCGAICRTAELMIESEKKTEAAYRSTKNDLIEVFERYGYKVKQ